MRDGELYTKSAAFAGGSIPGATARCYSVQNISNAQCSAAAPCQPKGENSEPHHR